MHVAYFSETHVGTRLALDLAPLSQIAHRARLMHQRVLAGRDYLGGAAAPADHDRAPACHRLRDNQPKRLGLCARVHDDIERAASYFALPSKFQNGTPVLTVDSQLERIAVNVALPCGAKAIEMRGAGRFTIVTFRLTRRPGGECGQGAGHRARGAIRVARGRIVEWYRLPDVPGGPQTAPPAPSGPTV